MRQASLFFGSLMKVATWRTIILTIAIFYSLGVTILRFDVILSLVSNLGLLKALVPVFSLYTTPFDTFSLFSFITFLVTATLFAFHIVALRLYTTKRFYAKGHHVSLFGVLSSLVGCLACCGSILIATMTAFIGVSLNSFPLGGEEIGLFGLLISFGALVYTIHKIDAPLTC